MELFTFSVYLTSQLGGIVNTRNLNVRSKTVLVVRTERMLLLTGSTSG